MGWLSGPEAAGLGEEENGNTEGVLVELGEVAEATAVNLRVEMKLYHSSLLEGPSTLIVSSDIKNN